MPFETPSLDERIKQQEYKTLQAISGLNALTDTLNRLDVDSDCTSSLDRASDAPDWWSPYYQKSLIAAVASLADHANQEYDHLTTLLRERREAAQ